MLPNRAPEIISLTKNKTGLLKPGESVDLEAEVVDPEDDAIVLDWQLQADASVGNVESVNTGGAIFRAPDSGSGQTDVVLTATDSLGNETRAYLPVSWGDQLDGKYLRLQVRDNPRDNNAMTGIVAALYNADRTQIIDTKSSDVDGVIDFGEVAQPVISFSIMFPAMSAQDVNQINTFVDVAAGEAVLYLDSFKQNIFSVYPECLYEQPVTLTATNMTNGEQRLHAEPAPLELFQWNSVNAGFANSDMAHCNVFRQRDGNMSWLAYTDDDFGSMFNYAFLLDVLPQQTAINLDFASAHQPVDIAWQTQPPVSLSKVNISGSRSGVDYLFYTRDEYAGARGIIRLPVEFPVDTYQITGNWMQGDVHHSSASRFSTVPETMALKTRSFQISNLNYSDNTFSWETGEDDYDLTVLRVYTDQAHWHVWLNADVRTLPLMPLPGITNPAVNRFEVEVRDYTPAASLADIWALIAHGSDLERETHTVHKGRMSWSESP
jgi:hypothetical protein